ncbi:hypothetical protein CMUS01_11523 [Colletotrichum musicola]|uniref:Uncharacterized protein n=1 Tax=Colletotrichum musicola TaxID=2175873 RepID=A0A8H6N515_9PEZI|nr:hypothetical protein CMUS01_11523 [Colletotrichum musicola]
MGSNAWAVRPVRTAGPEDGLGGWGTESSSKMACTTDALSSSVVYGDAGGDEWGKRIDQTANQWPVSVRPVTLEESICFWVSEMLSRTAISCGHKPLWHVRSLM